MDDSPIERARALFVRAPRLARRPALTRTPAPRLRRAEQYGDVVAVAPGTIGDFSPM